MGVFRLNKNLEQQAQTIFDNLFLSTKNFYNTKLGSVTENIKDRIADEKVVVLSAIKSGRLEPSDEFFNKKVYSKNTSKYLKVPIGNFAYNPSRINIGSIGINDQDVIGCVSPVYVVFSVDPDYQSFFEFYFKTSTFKSESMLRASGSVRQSLNYDDFSLIKIKFPIRETANAFNRFWLKQKKVIKYLQKENEKLSELRDTILPKLLSGELDVSSIDL